MIIVMNPESSVEQIEDVKSAVLAQGYTPRSVPGTQGQWIGIIGEKPIRGRRHFESLPGVRQVVEISSPFKLASREWRQQDTIVEVGDARIGGDRVVFIAGPCSVESLEQTLSVAKIVKTAGATLLRGGAYKPRTSPYSFQGLGEAGLKILREAGDVVGLPIVTEVMDTETVGLVETYADMLQVGSRNMQNFSLLKKVGKSKKPVLLKRGLAATVQETLLAAEYILNAGNENVVLCERGVRTVSDHTRFTLDVSAIPAIQRLSHLPVIVDPSHAAGKRQSVLPLALAGVAAGAQGVIVEVHPDPSKALSDGPQQLLPAGFEELVEQVRNVARAIGRQV
ncbi:MAG: 3-deoxy-7-phosphoheptulonate synthase [Lentisphaeria bacterium]|nr:3-deoxy-7-phosphoheptulonate synthase [Candidatus Neomarinimicrobiota bacterium]MCF7842661.1 3-deoxy-7-phosphoheptulonate synthase [Lentisphaeria bacterium]